VFNDLNILQDCNFNKEPVALSMQLESGSSCF